MMKKLTALLLALMILTGAAALAEEAKAPDSILDIDYGAFAQVEPYVAYAKSPAAGGFIALHWAPSRDAAIAHHMNDGGEVIVFAVSDDWAQVMDSESGYIGFVQAQFLTQDQSAAAEADEEKPYIDFDIKMDSIPQNYSYEMEENAGKLFATFTPENPADLYLYVSAAYSPDFAGYTLKNELSEEEFARAAAVLTAGFNDPATEVRETEHGTALIAVTENDAQGDHSDIVTVWQGYVIHITLQKASELTEEDMALATKIASDMWIVEQ